MRALRKQADVVRGARMMLANQDQVCEFPRRGVAPSLEHRPQAVHDGSHVGGTCGRRRLGLNHVRQQIHRVDDDEAGRTQPISIGQRWMACAGLHRRPCGTVRESIGQAVESLRQLRVRPVRQSANGKTLSSHSRPSTVREKLLSWALRRSGASGLEEVSMAKSAKRGLRRR